MALMQQDRLAASGDSAIRVNVSSDDLPAAVDLGRAAADTLARLDRIGATDATRPRQQWLRAQLRALAARGDQQRGATLSAEDELRQLYGVGPLVSWEADASSQVRDQLDRLLPGTGDSSVRLENFEAMVTVPRPLLPAVFERALAECRMATRTQVPLPSHEAVSVRYIVDAPWSGFSTYQGNGQSLVTVNTSYPLTVDRVLQLACHEGYPGHHAINVLRDAQAAAGRPELAAVPMFTPDAYETEAIATHATSLVFSDVARAAFERDVLFPLAGLDASLADRHVAVALLVERLAPAIGATLMDFLSRRTTFVEAAWTLQQDALMRHPQATLDFARLYGTFSLAYTGAAEPQHGIATEWLGAAGFPVESVSLSSHGHDPSPSSHGR